MRKMSFGKRTISMLLALVMVFSLAPMGVFAANTATGTFESTGTSSTSYLFFATDRHANTTVIGDIIDNMESVIGANALEYLGLGGDMVGSGNDHPSYNSSTVLGEVTGATSSLSATNVDIVAGIHDMNATDDAEILLSYNFSSDATEYAQDFSNQGGGAKIYEGDDYYVYGVTEGCISGDVSDVDPATEAAEFVTWANGADIDKSKVIIVLSHYPLHAKRGDNTGAGYWHNALNTVATGSATGTSVTRNVVFFHGHNHTVDSNEYCYAPGNTLSIQSYVDPSGVATVAEYDYYEELYDPEKDTATASDASTYAGGSSNNATASGTDATIYYTYATAGYLNANSNATLVAITDTSITLTKYGTSGSGTVMTSVNRVAWVPQTLAITAKDEYTVGETAAVSSDVSAVTVTYSDNTTQTLDSGASLENLTLTKITDSDGNEMSGTTFTSAGTYSLTYTYTIGNYQAQAVLPVTVTADSTDNTADSSTDTTASTTEPTDETDETDENESTGITLPDPTTQTGSTTTTTTTTKTVYVLTSSISSGSSYLIVNGNSAGSYYALANNSGSVTATSVTVTTDSTIGTYIELTDATDELWTVGTTNQGSTRYTFLNGSYYLGYTTTTGSGKDQQTTYTFGLSTSSRGWSWSSNNNNRLSISVGGGMGSESTTYYLRYNNGWGWTNSNSSSGRSIYFYVPTEIKVETTTTVSGTYSIDGKDVSMVVSEGSTAKLSSTLTFVITNGEDILTENPTGVTYTIVTEDANGNTVNGDPNNIISKIENGIITFTGNYGTAYVKVSYTTDFGIVTDYITVEAKAPYYSIEMHYAELTEAKDVTADNFSSGTYYTFNTTTNTYHVATEYADGTTYYVLPVISGEEIKEVVALKGIEKDDTYSVWAIIKSYDGQITEDDEIDAGEDGHDLGDVDDALLEWTISDESIATVDVSTGVITFTGENYGTFDLTAYYLDANGNILCSDTITISVTESLYVVPGDGTDDFPEYPNQGAVRFDKTATAVGNYSETGLALVELSMTGTPYSTGNAIDALLVLDMSTSMKTTVDDNDTTSTTDDVTRYDVTAAATKAFIKTIVQNDDGTYNSNTVAVHYFNGTTAYTDKITNGFITISDDDELQEVYDAIDALIADPPSTSGTDYSTSMKAAYDAIIARDAVSDNTQALVFMSDGGPTYYTYVNGNGYGTVSDDADTIVGWFETDDNDTSNDETDDTATPNSSFKTEYYSYMLKQAGYPVYTVGLGLSSNDTGPQAFTGLTSGAHEAITSYILSSMATNSSYFYNVADTDAVANMGNIFSAIAASIKEAATDVVIEDKIGSNYSINFSLPSGVTSTNTDGLEEFYIQVVDYVLDSTTHERTGVYTVLENFTFNTDGTLKSHTVDGSACGDTCSHVTFTDDVITAIDGTYFDYKSDSTGEYLTWTAEKITSTELTLQYFAYLKNSAGLTQEEVNAGLEMEPGVYCTNEYATLTYKNFQGTEVQQEFPVPQMTWKGAQVTYVFYLVNDQGQPVNRSGKVVPFADAIYVTDPVTFDVTWNDEEGAENILAKNLLASSNVPSVYSLYDESAYYEIRVYQTEGVDSVSSAVNYNYFIISGSTDKLIDSALDTDTAANNSTTVVFNTKAGTKYDAYGVYSAQDVGKVLNTTDADGNATTVTTTVKATDIDYADTTVAFAVVWKPRLETDTVIVDFGLDVVIDVITNDALAGGVVGVRADAPNVAINSGTNFDPAKDDSADVSITLNGEPVKVGTATVENLKSVRFSFDKDNAMLLNQSAIFYYEAGVNYYKTENGVTSLVEEYMYSSVIVIPASTVYYEDEYVDLKTYTLNDDGSTYKESQGWTTVTDGTTASSTQDCDRPGYDLISDEYDANNLYGYDSAYENCSKYSLGSAAMVNVYSGKYATATFTFYGTGFDIISLTDSNTGTILVDIYTTPDGGKTWVLSNDYYAMVDTYYGYAYGNDPSTEEVETDAWYTVASNSPNALYQVPVIKMVDMPYAQYKAVITVSYMSFMDHTDATGYDFYLDAIRIYDPVDPSIVLGVDAEEDGEKLYRDDIYAADNEGWPEYKELRDMIISKETFDSLNSDTVSGVVFIDGAGSSGAGNTTSVSDYTNYGPNNELYLAYGQSIAADLNAPTKVDYMVASVQLAIKTVGGEGYITVYGVDDNGNKTYVLNDQKISTATDMYYDITALNGMTLVIKNSGTTSSDAIISLTNIKVTYTKSQTTVSDDDLAVTSAQTLSSGATGGVAKSASARSVDTTVSSAAVNGAIVAASDETGETYLLSVTYESVMAAIASLTVEEEEEPEVTEPEETEPEETEPEETVPEETVPEETVPEETVPEETVPEETVPEETEPEETVPQLPTSDQGKPGRDDQPHTDNDDRGGKNDKDDRNNKNDRNDKDHEKDNDRNGGKDAGNVGNFLTALFGWLFG